MGLTFPSIQRSNSSESTKGDRHQYHYKRTSTLPPALIYEVPHQHPPYTARTRLTSGSSFGSESPRTPPRPKSPPPPPKSPKRFWGFSAQVHPPLPSIANLSSHTRSDSTNSTGLGTGATVVRRPSEAAKTMKQRDKDSKAVSNSFGHPPIETLVREYGTKSAMLGPGTVLRIGSWLPCRPRQLL